MVKKSDPKNINTNYNKEKRYYICKSYAYMVALRLLTDQEPFEYPHNEIKGQKVWSFKNTTELQETLDIMTELIAKNRKVGK